MTDIEAVKQELTRKLEEAAEPHILRTSEQMAEYYRKLHGADEATYNRETDTLTLGYRLSPKAEFIQITINKVKDD